MLRISLHAFLPAYAPTPRFIKRLGEWLDAVDLLSYAIRLSAIHLSKKADRKKCLLALALGFAIPLPFRFDDMKLLLDYSGDRRYFIFQTDIYMFND